MKNKGLGDLVSSIIKKASGGRIKECGECVKRKEWLNHYKIPYDSQAVLHSLHTLHKQIKGKE